MTSLFTLLLREIKNSGQCLVGWWLFLCPVIGHLAQGRHQEIISIKLFVLDHV